VAECVQTLEVCKAASERQWYAFDLTDEFARRWEPNHPYDVGQIVRPWRRPGTGLEYVSSGGVSHGKTEPDWPGVVGETVVDGSITWTAQAITYDSLSERLASADPVEWITDRDLVLADEVEQDLPALQEVRVWASGGTLGETYNCVAVIETQAGSIYECRLKVTIV